MVSLLQSGVIDIDYGDNMMLDAGYRYYERLKKDHRIIATPPKGLRKLWKYEARK